MQINRNILVLSGSVVGLNLLFSRTVDDLELLLSRLNLNQPRLLEIREAGPGMFDQRHLIKKK